jgi:hypothetical protein
MKRSNQDSAQENIPTTPTDKLILILRKSKQRFKKDAGGNPVKPDEAIVLYNQNISSTRIKRIRSKISAEFCREESRDTFTRLTKNMDLWNIDGLDARMIREIMRAFPQAIEDMYLNPFGGMNPHHETIPPDGNGDDDNGGGELDTDSYFYLSLKLDPPNTSPKVKATRGNPLIIAVVDSGIDLDYFNRSFKNFFSSMSDGPGNYPYRSNQRFHYLWNDKSNTLKTLNFVSRGHYPWDDNGHGHAISKIIKDVMRAHAPSGQYKIIPIKVVNAGGFLDQGTALQGVQKAIELGAHIINCSWSFPVIGNIHHSQALKRIIEDNPKICFVCSAGNDGLNLDHHQLYPASFHLPNLIPVIANTAFSFHHDITTDLGVASYSNYSRRRSLLSGPGRDFPLMIPTYGAQAILQRGKPLPAYVLGNGNSFSAGYISGLVGSRYHSRVNQLNGSLVFEFMTNQEMDHYLYEDKNEDKIPFYGLTRHIENHH